MSMKPTQTSLVLFITAVVFIMVSALVWQTDRSSGTALSLALLTAAVALVVIGVVTALRHRRRTVDRRDVDRPRPNRRDRHAGDQHRTH